MEQLSGIIGKARSTISEIISIASLPEDVKNDCRHDANIPKSILVDIARKKTTNEMLVAYQAYREKGLRRDAIRGNHRSSGTVVKRLTGVLSSFGRRLDGFELDQLNEIKDPQRNRIKNELENLEAKIKNIRAKLDI